MFRSLILLCLLAAGQTSAQTIRGRVFSGKENLPGAAVAWINTTRGTLTDISGTFSISSDSIADKRLVVSYVGFKTDTVSPGDRSYIEIRLTPTVLLKEAEIKGKRPGSFIAEDPQKTEVITSKELTKAACCDLAGCFETQATVQPQTTNIITNSRELRILGLSGVYNQMLFDGMPLFQGLSYTYGISSYPGTLISNIYVAKGANSVLQGYESISGQINVIPKDPENSEKFLLNGYMNHFGEKHLNINHASRLSPTGPWAVITALHMVRPASRFDNDGDTFLDLPLLTRYMLYNKWKYKNEDSLGFSAQIGLRFLNEERLGGQKTFSSADAGARNVYGQLVKYSQPELYVKTQYRLNEEQTIALSGSSLYHRQNSYFGTVKYDATQLNIYLNAEYELIWKEKHLFKTGISFRKQELKEDIAFTDTTLKRTYNGSYSSPQEVPGIFAENSFRWKDNTIIWMTGARIDRHQDFGYYFTPRTLLKYDFYEDHSVRGSAGMGWREVNLFSENINLLASSRDIIFLEKTRPERALNWGINYTWKFSQENREGSLGMDFYQTHFLTQFFPDYDTDPLKVYINTFNGSSVSNGFQVEANLKLYEKLELRAAYNYLDVYRIENGLKHILPFNSPNRIMAGLSYRPLSEKWYFDINVHWYDKARLPSTAANPEGYRTGAYSRSYILFNGQVTRAWKRFEVYAGCENIFDFRQNRPILGWQDPFGPYFDTSFAWGPTRGREIYAGFRWTIGNEQ